MAEVSDARRCATRPRDIPRSAPDGRTSTRVEVNGRRRDGSPTRRPKGWSTQQPQHAARDLEVLEVEPEQRLVYTFNGTWTLTWHLAAEGRGARLFLVHAGFDLDDKRDRDAYDRMGPGWRGTVLPRLAALAGELSD